MVRPQPCATYATLPDRTASRRFLLAATALGVLAQPLTAQDRTAPPSLEDLIPDSALDNPEEWASEGAQEQTVNEPTVDPDTPIDETGVELDWPTDLAIPEIEAIEPSEPIDDVQFADLGLPGPVVTFADAELVEVTDTLVLGFPQAEPPFTEQGDFVERFTALSTLRELDDDTDNIGQLAARAREDEELLNNILQVYGFYDGRVVRSIGSREEGDDSVGETPRVRFDVLPGERYSYGAIDFGALLSATDGAALRRAFEIEPGDFLQSDRIVEERFDLDRALGEFGYPFATIDEPQLLVDHARVEGDLTLNVQPNGKYVFAEVTSNNEDFLSGRHLATIARFEPGDVYQRSLELDLRRAITATGLVSSVTITPREIAPPQGDQPGRVAMDVGIEQADLRTIAGAIGYGSEEGFRIQASWEHRNFFPPEGLLRVRGIAGTQEQLAGVTFRKNNFGGRDRILNIDAYASTIDSPAFEARTVALVGTYERASTLLFQKPLSWSIGGELIATQERPPSIDGVEQPPRETFFVAAIPAFAQIDTSDDLLDPTRGFRIAGRLSPEASRSNGAESFYLRSRFDGSTYLRVNERIVLAGRTAFATIQGADLREIAPSRRLYAGGGGSVRGYGFREIGPRDALGEPSGGRSLVELSGEARIRTGFLDGAVSIVPFIDAGSVSASTIPDFSDIRIGAGIGARYHTGFGPIRVDVGVPLNPGPDDSFVAVYVSLGQAF